MVETSNEKKMTDSNDEKTAEIFQEGTFEIKTQAEIPVITKKARIVEEVIISKQTTAREEIVRDSVKQTDVQIEEISADGAGNRRNG